MARDQKHYIGLSRNVIINRYKADVSRRKKAVAPTGAEPTPKFSFKDFLTEKVLKWIEHSVRHLLGRRRKFKFYSGDDKGVYQINLQSIDAEVRIALAADWASDTDECIEVAKKIKGHDPHFTIHMGDTYYTGELNEITDNFLGNDPIWPRGSQGTFAMMGNHEMYSMANSYYDALLPQLGMRELTGLSAKKYLCQGASFFCLYSEHWLIIGLDTGYNSVGFPFVRNSFKNNGQLPDELVNWLIKEVKSLSETRGIILLSHHQYISAFRSQKNYATPGEQLATVFGNDRKMIWIWGHEHRFALYQKYSSAKGVIAYGRCIGHGGMPVELSEINVDDKRAGANVLVAVDRRERNVIDGVAIGWNGYAVIKIIKDKLIIEYYDQEKLLLDEQWQAANGTIKTVSITPRINDSKFSPQPGKVWDDAIKP